MNTEESFDPPIIRDLQDVHLELETKVEHNANFGDDFWNQRIKGPPHKLAYYYVQGAPSFARLIETKYLPKEPNTYVKTIIRQYLKQWEKPMQEE